jgi:hypothetical protein
VLAPSFHSPFDAGVQVIIVGSRTYGTDCARGFSAQPGDTGRSCIKFAVHPQYGGAILLESTAGAGRDF